MPAKMTMLERKTCAIDNSPDRGRRNRGGIEIAVGNGCEGWTDGGGSSDRDRSLLL